MAQLASAGDASLLPPPPSASLAWAGGGYEGEEPSGAHTPQRLGPGPSPRKGIPGWLGNGSGMLSAPNPAPQPLLFPSLGGRFTHTEPSAQDRSDEAYGRFAAVMADTIDGRMSLTECLEASQNCCRDICAGLRCVRCANRLQGLASTITIMCMYTHI